VAFILDWTWRFNSYASVRLGIYLPRLLLVDGYKPRP